MRFSPLLLCFPQCLSNMSAKAACSTAGLSSSKLSIHLIPTSSS